MNSIEQFFLEDDDEDEFNNIIQLCSPTYITKCNNSSLYQQIHGTALNLASEISMDTYEEICNADLDETLICVSNYDASPQRKRQKIMSRRFVYNTFKDDASEEFIDSDIEEEQIQRFLRSRQKKKIGKRFSSKSDKRSKLIELRLQNHFQDKSDDEFFHYLRITKATYQRILTKIKQANLFTESYAGGNFPVQADQALQMFLYYMGNQCTYKVLSDMYHVSESAIMSSFLKCVESINRLDDEELRWPDNASQLKAIQNNFKSISGFPGVIGSIGGCCVEMRTKKEPPAGYKIGKLRSIMYLLAVTDPNCRFIYIQAGFPGTFSLQEAFESSSLGEMIKKNSDSLFADENTHLVGNFEFVLHKHLLIPYDSAISLTKIQENYNLRLNETNVSKKAFSHLKNRFSTLQTQVYANLEKIPNIIKACCIIHNISLQDKDDKKFLFKNYKEIIEDYSLYRDDSDFVPSNPGSDAFAKRDTVAKRLHLS